MLLKFDVIVTASFIYNIKYLSSFYPVENDQIPSSLKSL